MQRRITTYALSGLLSVVPVACSLDTNGAGKSASDDRQSTGVAPDDSDASKLDEPTPSDAAVPRAATSTGCRAGQYTGTYQCQYEQRGLGFGGTTTTTVTGTVAFTLAESARPGTLDLTDGSFMPNATSLQTISASIEGSLVCGQDFAGMLVMGEASGYFVFNTAFETPLFARYDPRAGAFVEGTWSVPATVLGDGCTGSWSARYIMP